MDERSTWYGGPADEVLQGLDLPPDVKDTDRRFYVAWPPGWLEPIDDDGNRKVEWTEGLRSVCGLTQKETA